MIDTEFNSEIVETVTEDGLKITENIGKQYTLIVTPKRVEPIKIYKVNPQFGFYRAIYDSGKTIPELDTMFTSHVEALNAVKYFLSKTEQTKEAKYKERWGDKEIPELATKKPRGRKPKDAGTSESSKNPN